jgi:hypothetical protein
VNILILNTSVFPLSTRSNSDYYPVAHSYISFDDCDCISGYYKYKGYCAKYGSSDKCDYECPNYSNPKGGLSCIKDFDDCYCEYGYYKENGYCVKYDESSDEEYDGGCEKYCHYGYKKWSVDDYGYYCRFCDYECPQYSHRKYGRKCYDNFDDCECDYGYYKKHDHCVKY